MKEKTSKVKKVANCAFAAIAVCAMALTGCAKEEKVLQMVTEATFPPYEFREGGKIVGIDVDIVTEAARRIGYEVEIQDMAFNSVIAAVQTGKADIAASGITATFIFLTQFSFFLKLPIVFSFYNNKIKQGRCYKKCLINICFKKRN